MTSQAAWGLAIWKVRVIVAWCLAKGVFVELWDVFTAIFAIVSALAIAVLVWGFILVQVGKATGILE